MDGVKLYVGNLSYAVTNEQLKELFTQYGEVNQANVIEGKGFGFVEMATSEGAEKAKTERERHRLQRQGLEDRGSQAAEAQAAKQQGLRRQVLGRERAPHPAAHRACRPGTPALRQVGAAEDGRRGCDATGAFQRIPRLHEREIDRESRAEPRLAGYVNRAAVLLDYPVRYGQTEPR